MIATLDNRPNFERAVSYIEFLAKTYRPLLISGPIQTSKDEYIVYSVTRFNCAPTARGTKMVLEAKRFTADSLMDPPEEVRYGYTKGNHMKRAAQLMASV